MAKYTIKIKKIINASLEPSVMGTPARYMDENIDPSLGTNFPSMSLPATFRATPFQQNISPSLWSLKTGTSCDMELTLCQIQINNRDSDNEDHGFIQSPNDNGSLQFSPSSIDNVPEDFDDLSKHEIFRDRYHALLISIQSEFSLMLRTLWDILSIKHALTSHVVLRHNTKWLYPMSSTSFITISYVDSRLIVDNESASGILGTTIWKTYQDTLGGLC